MANNGNGNSTIKQSLEADLVMKDSGTIDAMLNKVKALHAEINGLQKSMDKAMGSRSAESGLAKQLQELTASMRTMKQQMESLGHASATSGQSGKLLFGATAAGELQGLKAIKTAEEQIYQQRIRSGEISITALKKETDLRKQKLALEALELKAFEGTDAKMRKRAETNLAALQKEYQLRQELSKDTTRQHNLALQEDRARASAARKATADRIAQNKADTDARAAGLMPQHQTAQTKKKAGVAADEVQFGTQAGQHGMTAIDRAIKSAQNKVEKFNVTEQLKAEAIANRSSVLTNLKHEELLAQMKLSNIRLTLAGSAAEQQAEYKTRLAIQEHINALKALEKTKKLTDGQQQAQMVAAGRLKMSQYDSVSGAALLGGQAKNIPDSLLQRLEQGQKARQMAGVGVGDDRTIADAQKLLDLIVKTRGEKKKDADEAKKAATEQKKTQADKINDLLDADARARKAREAGAIVASRDTQDAARRFKLDEAARIKTLAGQGLEMEGVKRINAAHEIADQLAASRHRQRAAQHEDEKKREGELQDLLRRRGQELTRLQRRQTESPEERARLQEDARRNTRERLFGDGGANTMIVQAGLMANYQVLGGLQSLLSGAASSAIEFDKALKQVQAVSAATRSEMVDLRQSLIEVAQSSRFSAAEVAQASVLLAQAGLSVKEIQQTMAATIALATASGSELKKSVDVMTSVLSVFDMGADKSTDVANKLTAALNMSKLDIDKMALGLQYAGNAAADAGVTFDELVSTLSAMANAGIRSGSTLGTGTRQLFVELQKPSENFKKVLDRLGVGMSQIDIKAQGFEGVLRNLQEAGFTTGDAFQSFQIRAASSFAALSNNINVFHDMQDAIEGTNAAMEANEIQMESLAVQYDHLKSNLGIVAAEGFAPVLAATRDTVKMFAHFFEGAEKGSASLKAAFTALAGAALAVTAAVSLNMLVGLVKLGGGMRSLFMITAMATKGTHMFTAALALNAAGARGAALAYGAASVALRALQFAPVILGIGLLITAFISFGKESDKLKDKLDEARTTLNGFVEANSKSQQTIENVDEAINTLATRYGRLSSNSQELDGYVKELANQFKEQGLTIENLAGQSIEKLIETLGRLRTELSDDYIINIREEGDAQEKALKLESERKLALAREKALLLPDIPMNTRVAPGAKTIGQQRAEAAGAVYYPGGDTGARLMTPEEQLRGVVKAIATAGTALAREQAIKQFGFKDEGAVNKQLSGILANPKILPNQSRYFGELENIMGLNQAGRGVEGRIETVRKNKEVAIAREKLTAAAHLDPNSGYQITTRMRSALSVENKNNPKTGASLDYLETNNKLVEAKLDEIKAQRELIKNSVNVQDMAKYQALGDEEAELAKMKSTYEQQMAPLIVERNKMQEDKAKYELEDAEKEVKRIEKQIKDEKNINLLTDGMADKLAAARRVLGQKRIEALVAEMTRAGASPARIAMAKARLEKEIQSELEGNATSYLNDAKDALIKENKDFDQKLGKDALTAPFKEIDKQLDNFDTNLKGLLDERSGSVSAKVRQLKQRIQDNRLAGAGIATSGDLYGPKALGRNNDLADLSFRRRAGAQFRSAALGKELQKAQVEEAKIKVSAIDAELPKLLALQDTHQAELEKLQGTRDASRAELDKLIDQQDQAEKDGTSLSPAFADKKKQAYEDWKVRADVYDAQEKQANNIKDKIYGLEDTKGNLLDTLGNQEGKFGMWLDAMRTGVEGLTQSFSDMFQRIVTGTGDTEEAFREMGRGILASMLKVISDKIAQKFMEMAMGFIGNALMPSPVTAGPSGMGIEAGARIARHGGPIHRRAGGGYVPGSVARDAVPTLLMPGEFVLQKSASAALGEDFLHGLNRTTGATMRQGAERAAKAAAPAASGEPSSVNVWVVTPDQQTGMSKDDIIVTVGDNIARNGSIRKLIKQVQVGG